MTALLDHEGNVTKKVEGTAFYDASLPKARTAAQTHAGEGGYVASLPQILRGRVVAPFDNEIWMDWFTANSEELIGTTSQGTPVVIAVHGGGVLSNPARIEQAYKEGLLNYSVKLDVDKEFRPLLSGRLPDGTSIPVFESVESFLESADNLPRQYAVIMDFDTVMHTASGEQTIDELRYNQLVHVRAGGVQAAHAYLDRASEIGWRTMGNWHPFRCSDPLTAQGHLLWIGCSNRGGLDGERLYGDGRFVAVGEPEARHAENGAALPPLDRVAASLYRGIQSSVAPENRDAVKAALRASFENHLYK